MSRGARWGAGGARAAWSIVLGLGTVGGCTLNLPGTSDDGGSGGTPTPDAATTETVGEQCTQILDELCSQAINRCGLMGFTVTDCVTSDTPQCCSTTCGDKSTQPSSTVDACKAAFDAEDCNDVTNSTTPSACTTLLGS